MLDDCIAVLDRLIAFPSVSEDSNLELIAYLAERLERAGAAVRVLPDATGSKANLFATFGPEADGGLVLAGHTDVVPAGAGWSSDPFRLRQDSGRLFGRGACDMKGFVAACVAMAPAIAQQRLRRPIHFAFTHDEEVGCLGAQALAKTLLREGPKPKLAIIGEPTGMKVVEGHKGCNEYTTRFTGFDGHASAPQNGVNAVEYASAFVTRLVELGAELRDRTPHGSRFNPPWSTVNVGRMSGGTARNVIAGAAVIDWEMRPVTPEDATFVKEALSRHIEEALAAMRSVYPDAAIVTATIGEVVGLTPTHSNEARDLVMSLTGETTASLVPFGTEAGIFQSLGMDAVLCGPGHIAQAHRPDEYLDVAQMASCLDMLVRLVTQTEQ